MLPPAALSGATVSSDPVCHDLSQFVLDFLRRPIRVHNPHAAWFFGGERQKTSTHLSVEPFCLPVQPVLFSTIGSPPGEAN
jgi:hypothetical protein